MPWISDALSSQSAEILRGVEELQEERKADAAVTPEEMMEYAESSLVLMTEALATGVKAPLYEYWESVGRGCADRKLAMSEMPDTSELLKKSIWATMEKQVEAGCINLPELVDSMLEVEAILSDCRVALVRSYLDAREIQVAEKSARMEALYSLTKVLSTETEERELYSKIVKQVSNITGLTRCSLLLFDEEGLLRPVASNSGGAYSALSEADPQEISVLAAVGSLDGPVVIRKGGAYPREIEGILESYDTPTVLLVPLQPGKRSLGLMLLDQGKEGEFTREQIDMAVACANQAAIAVEKGGLLDQMEKRLKHMAAIGIVAKTLTSYLDADEQFESLLEMGTALMRADSGAILLVEEMFKEPKIAAGLGDTEWYSGGVTMEGVARWVIENGETVLLQRGIRDPRFKGLEMKVEESVTAPLLVQDKVIGVISVAGGRPGDHYAKYDLEMFGNFAAQAAVSIENTRLNERLQDAYLGTIASLAAAIEARDPYTVGHSARVTKYAVAIAEAMGISENEVEDIRLAGLLHDLGKIGIPDNILNKPGRLTDEEYSAIKMHPTLSIRIIEPLPHLGNIIPIIYHHHERYDGNGYVEGMAGEKIPLGARILAAADSYEAMTSDRPYREALSREDAIAELRRNSGSQFDPEVVKTFVDLLESHRS